MNKKLLSWLVVGFLGLAFLFGFIGIFAEPKVMCILAMIFALGGLVTMLLLLLYKPKSNEVETSEALPPSTPTAETTTL